MIQISLALKSIYDNLGAESVFEQICLTDNTFVLVVNDDDRATRASRST